MDVRRLLAGARAGDPTATAALWRAIEAGEVPDADALTWLSDVAHQVVVKVLDADIESNRRAEAALKAIGFEGKLDPIRELREDVAAFDPDGIAPRAEVVQAISLVHFPDDDPRKIAQRVDRVRMKKPKAT